MKSTWVVSLCILLQEGLFNPSTAVADEQNAPPRLLIVHGGFNSCGGSKETGREGFGDAPFVTQDFKNNKANIFDSFHYKLTAGNCHAATAAGVPCYNNVNWLRESLREQLDPQGAINWFVSCQTTDLNSVIWVDSRNPTQSNTGSRDQMWASAVKLANDSGPAVVTGHSYGGWTAMQTALKLGRKLKHLSTLDPISPVKCTPAGVAFGSKECKRFPSDLNASIQAQIRLATDAWSHYWQTVDDGGFLQLGLHSGPTSIEGVDEEQLNLSHTQLDVDEGIWITVRDAVAGISF